MSAPTINKRPQPFFKTPLRPGQPVSTNGLVAGIMELAKALETIEVVGGRIEWKNGRPRLIID